MKRNKVIAAYLLLFILCFVSIYSQDLYPVKRLTFEDSQDSFPSWSPDGDRIIYSRLDRNDSTNTGLWHVAPTGGIPRQLINTLAEHPHWSPAGHYIVFDADTGNNIKLVASTGGRPIRLLPDSIHIRKGGTPCWSPDGTQIAFRERYSLKILNISSGQIKCIFEKHGFLPIPNCWTIDGNSVIATIRDEKTYESTMVKICATSYGLTNLSTKKGIRYRYADISPDGTLLVYSSKESGSYNLWVMPVHGGKALQLTSESPADDGPRWSPDGTSITFVSRRSGNADIWIMDVDFLALKQRIKDLN